MITSSAPNSFRKHQTDYLACPAGALALFYHFWGNDGSNFSVSIFREKAKEYKKILDLKASDKVRDTFYSEILDIIAAYESGFADAIKQEYKRCGRILTRKEVESLFHSFENMALWKPLIQRGRIKMASRDMALRDAFHYQLSEYIQPLDRDEYQKFLGAAGDQLERLMAENQEVLKRLKERE